jgi:hypothetical protein
MPRLPPLRGVPLGLLCGILQRSCQGAAAFPSRPDTSRLLAPQAVAGGGAWLRACAFRTASSSACCAASCVRRLRTTASSSVERPDATWPQGQRLGVNA